MKAKRIAELQRKVPMITPKVAHQQTTQGAILVDVRDEDETRQGSPVSALRIGRSFLELVIEDHVADKAQPLLVMCAGGLRSLFAADNLMQLGYDNVQSVSGGFIRWKNDNLPFEIPTILDQNDRARYSRHLLIPEVGEAGQIKLLESKVLLVGAGGLGSPAAYYLAAAGVGQLGIVDHDVVDRSNLQRQILHTDERVGQSKVASAKQTLLALNPDINVVTYDTRLESHNIDDVFSGYDIVVDGSDNFPTRYLVNDACVKHNLPNVHGSIYRFEGQVTVFWPHYAQRRGPCYRCLYPAPPPPELAPSCAEAGVLGVLPGVIGMLEAVETIKILIGIGNPLVGRLLQYDALRAEFNEFSLDPDSACAYCNGGDFPGYIDYPLFCGQV